MDPKALTSMMGSLDQNTLSSMMKMSEQVLKDNPDLIEQVMQFGNKVGIPTTPDMPPSQPHVMPTPVPETRKKSRRKKTKDLRLDIEVSLEELYKGTTIVKIVKTKRLKTDDNGNQELKDKKNKITWEIPAGTEDGETLIKCGAADQHPDIPSGDIILKVIEKEHDTFERNGNNLHYTQDISISEVFGLEFSIKHLDGTVKNYALSEDDICYEEALNSEAIRIVQGEGMPIVDSEDGERGDLIIRLNLRMPDVQELKEEHIRKALITAFPPINKKDEEAGEPVQLKNMSEEDKEKYEEDIFSEGYDEDELFSDLEDTDSDDDDEEEFDFEITS